MEKHGDKYTCLNKYKRRKEITVLHGLVVFFRVFSSLKYQHKKLHGCYISVTLLYAVLYFFSRHDML